MKLVSLALIALIGSSAFAKIKYDCTADGGSSSYFAGSFTSFRVAIDDDNLISGGMAGGPGWLEFNGSNGYEAANASVDFDKDGALLVSITHDIGHDQQTLTFHPKLGESQGSLYEFIDCLGESHSKTTVTCSEVAE
jgi:hypothetical protein